MSRKKNKLKNKEQNKLQDKYLLFTFYAVFIAVVFIIYGKTKSYDFAIDDKIILVDNIYVIDGISGFTKLIDAAFNNDMSVPGVTRPVAMFSHALDVSLFGMEAGKHHQMNIFYYFILLFLLFYLLRKYFIPNYSVFLSFLIVLLFIAHPVHVESVANIKGRDDILSFIFGTLAFIFFFRNLKENSIINRILIFLSLALAFLSKETGIVFALLLPISYYYFTEVDFKKAFLSTYMYLAFGILLVIIRFSLFTPPPEYINKYNNSILDLESPLQQLAMTLRILWHYLQISLWPQPLIWDYSFGHFDFNKYTNFLAVVSALVYSGLLLWSLLKLKSKNMISFGIIFFLLALSPVSNLFIKIATTFGERLLFIPSFGIVFAFVFLVYTAYKKLSTKYHFRNDYRLYLLILIVSSGFVFMSEARTKAWENDEILVLTDYQHSKSIRSYKAFIQYETSISDQKIAHHQTAYQACMEGLDKFPTDWELWYFRGVIQSTLNDIEDAKFAYEKSIEYKSENFLALVNYGNLLTKDEPEKAIELYKKAVLVKDDNAIIYGNLALLLHQKGKLTEAKEYYEKSLIINPNNSQVKRAYDMLRETLKENPEVEIK